MDLGCRGYMLQENDFAGYGYASYGQAVTTLASRIVRAAQLRVSKDIYLRGGGVLAKTLFDAGLIDEVLVKVNPVMIGSGKDSSINPDGVGSGC